MLIPVVLQEQLASHTSPVSSADNLLIRTNPKRSIVGLTWCLIRRQFHCKRDTIEDQIMKNKCITHIFKRTCVFFSFSLQPDPSPLVSEQQRHRLSAGYHRQSSICNAMAAPQNINLSHMLRLSMSLSASCLSISFVLPLSLSRHAWYFISSLWGSNECLLFCSSALKPHSHWISFTRH